MTDRAAEIAANLADVRARIEAACKAAGRSPEEVRLLAVTKTFPASDAAILAGLGVRDLAENRDQEAAAKAAEVDAPVRWHMVGRLQRNKARSVVRWADEVQSVDSTRLAEALARAVAAARDAGERTEPLDVLVQASIDGDPARGGCPLDRLPELAHGVIRSSDLRLRGIMAVAPLGMEPRAAFDRLASVAGELRTEFPTARELSCGMSNDLEEAIDYGSTCVRVGTALLGGRGLASP
ncbi:YggS family pyridoxal phosphate-dependent enzyme [Actinokineospora sp. UTMC 2448]|uniref:YggS family pyridoxal phosphate-dependent enzyme n=1 Tax=Actinokineospora sp. UTMC 2448 TaxID=2268449 RepID=UPI0021643150|nr:YggS family pyridoxal phosphate-dependent enzyme [Actinokineospora sp. UTMC 2448]UVS80938.1 pyridoxal phosphate enzyme, YggS family [Actinokineospora sp. UTMC 2448]